MQDDNYYTFDGHTSEITSASVQIFNYYVYDPFGRALRSSETVNNDFCFVGQFGIRQIEDDLLFMRARFYSQEMGRFLSEDPLDLGGGDVSFYRYVGNDPVNWVDPWGYFFTTPEISPLHLREP